MNEIEVYRNDDSQVSGAGTQMTAEECFALVDTCTNVVNDITGLLSSAAVNWKQIDCEMHRMDLQFQAYAVHMETNLEMYKTRAPIISQKLDSMTRCMEKVLDKVLEMDADTSEQLDLKMRYIDMVETYMNNLSSMMVKLL